MPLAVNSRTAFTFLPINIRWQRLEQKTFKISIILVQCGKRFLEVHTVNFQFVLFPLRFSFFKFFYFIFSATPPKMRQRIATTTATVWQNMFRVFFLSLFLVLPSLPSSRERERVRVLLLSFSSCDLLILYSLHEGEFRDKGRNWECLWVREGERESVSLLGWIYAHFSIPAPGGSSSSSSYLTWLTQISEMVSILWLAVVKEIWDECCKTFLNTILATMYLLYVCDEDMWQELWLQDRYLISIHN